MNKKGIFTLFFAFVTLTMTAQERLIRVDSASIAWRKSSSQLALAHGEMARLLMPQGTAFGVECHPSFSPEWALTYDSLAHALVYKQAEKSIWHTTYKAMHKLKKVNKTRSKWVLRKHPKDYVAPSVLTYSLAVTDEQALMLKAIWTSAIGTAENKEDLTLDGTTWEYFIGGQRAKARRENNALIKFTSELTNAVKTGDVNYTEHLIGNEFQRVVSNLTIETAYK